MTKNDFINKWQPFIDASQHQNFINDLNQLKSEPKPEPSHKPTHLK